MCLLGQLPQDDAYARVTGLVLENPFANIPDMVKALYTSKWVPYRYLTAFVWDRWDALDAMRNINKNKGSTLARLSQDMLVLLSEKDEMVPKEMGEALFEAALTSANEDGSRAKKVVVADALHENMWEQKQWSKEVLAYINKTKPQHI